MPLPALALLIPYILAYFDIARPFHHPPPPPPPEIVLVIDFANSLEKLPAKFWQR